MRFRHLTAALTGLLVTAGSAHAQVSYTFSTPDFFGGLSMSWTVERPGPVESAGAFSWTSCDVAKAVPEPLQTFACTPEQDFNPNGFGTGYSYVSASFEEFFDGDPAGGGTGFFFFDAGAFLANGTYQASRDALLGDGGGFYGSAGDATLIVSGIASEVPEPTSMALMTVGLFSLGVAARRRRGARSA